MPDPRQQDHSLGEGGLMFGKYITIYNELWRAEVLKWSNSFTDFCRNSVNVIFPSKVFINQHTKIVNIIFGLQSYFSIFVVIEHVEARLVSDSFFIRVKDYKVSFCSIES